MNEENPYLRPAFDEGAARARLCISRNDDPTMCSNPYLPSTDDFRAWNLGWNTTLMSEIRTPPPTAIDSAKASVDFLIVDASGVIDWKDGRRQFCTKR